MAHERLDSSLSTDEAKIAQIAPVLRDLWALTITASAIHLHSVKDDESLFIQIALKRLLVRHEMIQTR